MTATELHDLYRAWEAHGFRKDRHRDAYLNGFCAATAPTLAEFGDLIGVDPNDETPRATT